MCLWWWAVNIFVVVGSELFVVVGSEFVLWLWEVNVFVVGQCICLW